MIYKKNKKNNYAPYRSISNPRNSSHIDINQYYNKGNNREFEQEKNNDRKNKYYEPSLIKSSSCQKLPLIKSHNYSGNRLSIMDNGYNDKSSKIHLDNEHKYENFKDKLANLNVLKISKQKIKPFKKDNDSQNETNSPASHTARHQIEQIKKSGIKLKVSNKTNQKNKKNENDNAIISRYLGDEVDVKHKVIHRRNLSDFSADTKVKDKFLEKYDKLEENIDSEVELVKNFEFLSRAGKSDDGKTKTNQDSYLVNHKINGLKNFHMFGVLDGHGVNGHFASCLGVQFLKKYFNTDKELKALTNANDIYKKLKDNDYQFIKTAFRKTERELSLSNYDFSFSGTTCVIVFIIGKKMICANTGDSRAILISKNINTNEYNVKAMSRDHKPNLVNEKKRIESKGGEVHKFKENGEEVGPFRVWVKGEGYPGLAMSRSIGDLVASKVGVEPEAEVKEFDINDQSKFIIIASDGVWEFLKNSYVMNLCKKFYEENDNQKLCKTLVKESVLNWEKDDTVIDDITCVSIFF